MQHVHHIVEGEGTEQRLPRFPVVGRGAHNDDRVGDVPADHRDDRLAVGFHIRPFPGAEKNKVILSTEILEKGLGDKVVFIGGGMAGCEEGIYAAKNQGKDVTIVEKTGDIASNAPFVHNLAIKIEFEKLPERLHVMTNSQVVEIRENGVVVENASGARSLVECDTMVMCVGTKPKAEEAESLHNLACYSRIVGDAKKSARMNEAVTDGYFAGYYVQEIED